MTKARYICFEGTEGVGKTTQINLLYQNLIAAGYKVLLTKEPGTPLAPLTMVLRGVMLDKQYDAELTPSARELVSQAIRSIHLEKVIYPNLNNYDFILQDRGILSGLAYGKACGNDPLWLDDLAQHVVDQLKETSIYHLYDDVIILKGDVSKGLNRATTSKQEFKAGDAIEAKGVGFLNEVAKNMDEFALRFNGVKYIDVNGKSIADVSKDIVESLNIVGLNNG